MGGGAQCTQYIGQGEALQHGCSSISLVLKALNKARRALFRGFEALVHTHTVPEEKKSLTKISTKMNRGSLKRGVMTIINN